MPFIKDPKKRGEWVELQFMARAQSHGLSVLKPWGDSLEYDFIVEHNGSFHRVQVKSTSKPGRNGYDCKICHGYGIPYRAHKLDFFAVFVIPEDIWYILPYRAVARHGVRLNPHRPHNRYSRFIEAWHQLKGNVAETSKPRRSRRNGLTKLKVRAA